MKELILNSISRLEILLSHFYLSFFEEKKSLISILIHGLFNDKSVIQFNVVDPQQSITIDLFRKFIEYFLENNYLFISPQEIINGLEITKNYVLITFDDGYYNNHLALSVLNEYRVPATFFISTNHVIENKAFWWDVVFRERIKKNFNLKKIKDEITFLKKKKNKDIEEYLINNFGKRAIFAICDIDRPFTQSELASFSKEQLVTIGNHTSNHAILTNYSYNEIESEIIDCQIAITNITGIKPLIISYPNGNYSKEVIQITKANGFKLGITGHPNKNILPINLHTVDSLLLNRYTLVSNISIKEQCLYFRCGIQLKESLKSLFKYPHLKIKHQFKTFI